MKFVITLDVGTTSVKATLFNEQLSPVKTHSHEYRLLTQGDRIVEVPPDLYWEALKYSIRSLIKPGNINPTNLRAIAITTQGETFIPVDETGNPLSNAIVWLDSRANEQAEQLSQSLTDYEFYHITGLPELTAATPISKIMWIKQKDASVYKRTHKFLYLEDYLVFRLTGKFVSEYSLLSSSGYFDIRRKAYSEDILRKAKIDPDKLPEIIKPASIISNVTKGAANETGLSESTLVISTAMDQICGMVGAGNVEEGIVTETTGTCLSVGATVSAPDFEHPAKPMIYTHFDHKYAYLPYNQTAGIVLKWLKENVLLWSQTSNNKNMPYDSMIELASSVPAGSDGIILLPHFAGKLIPTVEQEFRGSFLGINLNTTNAHLIRTVLEGVAFMLRENIEYLGKLGVNPQSIRSLGGGSKSDTWCQIKSDVLNLPLLALSSSESVSLGAAILAQTALGNTDFIQQTKDQPCFRKCFKPNAGLVDIYDKAYSRYIDGCRTLSRFYSKFDDGS